MRPLLAQLLPLAVAAAVNPGMIIVVLSLLLSAAKPLERATAFVLGAAATSGVVGVVAVVGISALPPIRHIHRPFVGESVLFVVLGALILIGTAWEALRRPTPVPKPGAGDRRQRYEAVATRPLVAFMTGAGLMLSNLKALALYMAAVKYIVDAPLGVAATALFVLGFMVVMLSPMIAPIVIYLLDRRRAATILATVRTWILAHTRSLVLIVGAIAGSYFLVRGIVGLVS